MTDNLRTERTFATIESIDSINLQARDKHRCLPFIRLDQGEPSHIHVKRDRQIAKFWLDPVSLATHRGFKRYELNRVERLVIEYREMLIEVWHDYFGS